MINEEKIVEFLEQHKRNPENLNSDGNYDPNPYWFAEELIKLFVNYNESREKICPTCRGKGHMLEFKIDVNLGNHYHARLCDNCKGEGHI